MKYILFVLIVCLFYSFSNVNDVAKLNDMAADQVQKQNYDSALVILASALKNAPNNDTSLYIRSTIKFYQKDYQGAETDILNAIRYNPENLDYKRFYISSLVKLGKFTQAISLATELIEDNSKDTIAYAIRAKAYSESKEWLKAVDDYTKLLEISPNSKIYSTRAKMYSAFGYTEKAIADYTQAIKLDSGDAPLFQLRAFANLKIHKKDDAMRDFNRSIDLDSTTAIYYSNRSMLHRDLRHPVLAMTDLSKAIMLDSMFIQAWQLRAMLKRELNDLNGSIKDYQKCLKINPNDTLSLYALVIPLAKSGNERLAEEYCSRLISLCPRDAKYYALRSSLYMNQDRLEDAIKDMNYAIEFDKFNASYYANRAILKFYTNIDSMCDDFTKAKELGYVPNTFDNELIERCSNNTFEGEENED